MMKNYLLSQEKANMIATSRKMNGQHENNYEFNLPFNITDVTTLPSSFRYDKTTPIKNQRSW